MGLGEGLGASRGGNVKLLGGLRRLGRCGVLGVFGSGEDGASAMVARLMREVRLSARTLRRQDRYTWTP